MGKISPEDRDRLRAELRDDALRELAHDALPTAPAPETRKACECGKQISAGDRVCSQCGQPL